MHRVGLAALTLQLTLAAGTGCAHGHAVPAEEQPVPDNVLALEVDNRNWSDVLISVIHDGNRSRFVEVSATRSLTVAIPPRFVGTNGTLRLLLHRIGGVDDYLTPTVSVRTGNTVNVTIESDLNRSTVGVW